MTGSNSIMKFIHPIRNKFLSGAKNNLIFSARGEPALGWLLPILSGVLLFLSYPPYNLEFFTWIALIPLFLFIASKKTSLKKAFIGGTLTGILFFGKIFDWLFSTYPFEWLSPILGKIGKETVFVFIFLIVLHIIQTVFLSLFLGAFCFIAKKVAKLSFTTFWSLIIIPALWIILEYLRAWGFGILYLGKETFFGPHWTFGNLAYTLSNKLALIQIADISGIYGISFLIVLINIIFFSLLKNSEKLIYRKQTISHKNIIVLFILFSLIITLWAGYGIYKLNLEEKGDQRKIALLQTNFLSGSGLNPYSGESIFKTVLNLFRSQESKKENPDIIIAPEGFGIVSLTTDIEITKYLLRDFWQPGQIYLENQKIIIDSPPNQNFSEGGESEEIISRLFYYDLEREEPIAFYDKMLLVPNGEFLPYLTKIFLNIYSFDIGYGQRFYKKGEKIRVAQTPKANIGGSICSSIVSPSLQRQMTKKGAEVLIVVSSDAPFHGAKTLLAQNLAMSKLRAIENRRYFAQATNMGYSFLLNSKGRIIAKTSQLGNKILFSNIYLLNKKTIYTKFGDWIILIAILIVGGIFFIKFYKDK